MGTQFVFAETMEVLGSIPQYQTVLAAFLVIALAGLIAKKRLNPRHKSAPSDEEVEKKLSEWIPEPLIPNPPAMHPSLTPRCVTSKIGKRMVLDGFDCLNLGTHNYLGMSEKSEIENKAEETVRKYGVGSCGPRGFYGTVDVHLELEEKLAKFTGTEEAVVYCYGFSTIASAVAAYCKRRDVVFADEKVNFAIQKGLDASRSNIKYFKHNDVEDLASLLEKQEQEDKKKPKVASKTKKFLIIEGIYMNTGKICPLPELVALCKKYKLRIFIDESISFGTLGAHGKGVTEHFNVPSADIDLIMGSLETAIGSVGGFCVGTSFVIEHQRLSGLGYCFSASLPPLLTAAAITSLEIMEKDPKMFDCLKQNCIAIHNGLKDIDSLECFSFPESPVKHLYLKKKSDRETEETLISSISKKCIENKLAVIPPVYLEVERLLPRPSLRLCISTLLDKSDIDFALSVLKKCAEEVEANSRLFCNNSF